MRLVSQGVHALLADQADSAAHIYECLFSVAPRGEEDIAIRHK